MKQMMGESLAGAAQGVGGTVLVVGLTSSLLAERFWLAELLVNFQVHFIICLLVCLFLLVILRRHLTAAAFVLGTFFLAMPVIPYVKLPGKKIAVEEPRGNERVYRILNYNVLQTNDRTQDIADYIATERIDFMLLLETDKTWSEEMEFELRDHFPHRFAEPRADYQGLTFYSKHPWKSIRLVTEFEEPVMEAVFLLAEGPLTLLGIHAPQPVRPESAARRNALFKQLGDYAAGLSGSVVVAGDFNATPWSPRFQALLERSNLDDSAWGRGIQNTWYRFPVLFLGLPIDHILVRGVAVRDREIGPPIGSDHRPVLLNFLLRSAEAPAMSSS